MSRAQRFLCGTPEGQCTGSHAQLTAKWSGSSKVHATREDAKRCYVHYLKSQGYVQLSANEFQLGDGPVVVLTRTSRFGGVMRQGKEKRFMPRRGSGEITG